MKKQKTGIIVILAAALLITALVAGCMDPINLTNLPVGSNGAEITSGGSSEGGSSGGGIVISGGVVKEAGKIVLKLNFNDSNARTIMPDTLASIDTTNYYVRLTHTNEGEDEHINEVYTDSGITLVAGNTYTLKVEARTDANLVVAAGEYVDNSGALETIDADVLPVTPISVALYLVDDDETATGTFAYTFDLSSNFDVTGSDTATITLKGLSTSALAQDGGTIPAIDLTTSNSVNDTKSLVVGYYEVILRIVKGGNNHFDVVLGDTLQVYQGQTSVWNPTIPAPVPKLFTITYDVNGGNTPAPTAATGIAHRGTIASAPTPPTHSTAHYNFYEWYTAANDVQTNVANFNKGIKWVFGAPGTGTPVFGNQTIYAAWKDDTPPSTVITITFSDSNYNAPTEAIGAIGAINAVYNDHLQNPSIINSPLSITITDGMLSNLNISTFAFYIDIETNGTDVTSAFTVTNPPSTDDILITFDAFNSALLPLYILNTPINLRVTAKTGEKYWGGHIAFTLQPGSPSP